MPHLKSSAGGGAYERYLQDVQSARLSERLQHASAVVDSSTPLAYQYRRPNAAVPTLRRHRSRSRRKKSVGRGGGGTGNSVMREGSRRLPPPTTVVDLPHLRNARHPLRREVDKVNYENTFFFDRVYRRRQEPSRIDHHQFIPPNFSEASRSTANKRKKELREDELEQENDLKEQRIRETTTHYPVWKAEEEFEEHCEIKERIRQYEDTDEDDVYGGG